MEMIEARSVASLVSIEPLSAAEIAPLRAGSLLGYKRVAASKIPDNSQSNNTTQVAAEQMDEKHAANAQIHPAPMNPDQLAAAEAQHPNHVNESARRRAWTRSIWPPIFVSLAALLLLWLAIYQIGKLRALQGQGRGGHAAPEKRGFWGCAFMSFWAATEPCRQAEPKEINIF
ncbi:hypothetical protein LTR53_001283 [Teratosphaeriaceae sp. CCFEE 6253]|nr:hypothetical protein LTR53_001283 [Teratosphaeriaceae sp. CCFEE 6253]